MSEGITSGTGRVSLARAAEVLERWLADPLADAGRTGEDLFAVTSLLDDSVALRRALTDPARPASAKAEFVRRVFGGRVGQPAVEVTAALAEGRWAAARDMADATERLAVVAVAAQAERSGRIETLEDELFRFSRTIGGTPQLRDALADRSAPAASRAELVSRLLAHRAAPESVQLARRAATAPRGLRAERVLERYLQVITARRQLLVAHVVSSVPLTEQQHQRLAAGLERTYGRSVRLNVDVDPHVLGGLRVSIGDEVIDGTVSTRLAEAKRRLAG
ncbi:F-type H+-transporting ATPase subunit delta [Kineococcus xinjiangensis]|uniref:ATP synthase subunit delta n=1 Tax=Kineococcus xinjiangensis TaxID=512762 RepID=A0A2S6IWP2_9ACTN|nr:F0F1 ATP synthase subunit delta [Kineococcus xinjiangensis]PPK98660.1 F-type H+-transporting ATPase subunit delta [Kineococcus xinjiangensis]